MTPLKTPPNHSHHLTFGDLLLFTSFITFFALLTILLCCCCIIILVQNRLHRRGGDAATSAASSAATNTTATASEALSKLPVFVFSSSPPSAAGMVGKKLECAVCLAEFKDGEKGRLLPRCSHSFHIECIDAWLDSRSTCPLCRATV